MKARVIITRVYEIVLEEDENDCETLKNADAVASALTIPDDFTFQITTVEWLAR